MRGLLYLVAEPAASLSISSSKAILVSLWYPRQESNLRPTA